MSYRSKRHGMRNRSWETSTTWTSSCQSTRSGLSQVNKMFTTWYCSTNGSYSKKFIRNHLYTQKITFAASLESFQWIRTNCNRLVWRPGQAGSDLHGQGEINNSFFTVCQSFRKSCKTNIHASWKRVNKIPVYGFETMYAFSALPIVTFGITIYVQIPSDLRSSDLELVHTTLRKSYVSFCFSIISLNIRHIECAWKVQSIFRWENSSCYMVCITSLTTSVCSERTQKNLDGFRQKLRKQNEDLRSVKVCNSNTW